MLSKNEIMNLLTTRYNFTQGGAEIEFAYMQEFYGERDEYSWTEFLNFME